ncbi:hypothetical protein E2C01_072962 [Portunus trituberculatus]|uniref:Uncharacterized protein n=1 Tax=Portunus trituberculatus TaxID=210409 RepID=A0A5B7I8L1_PORTR|nr:hypothetical protein [Portunus trituberculatus]
MPLTDLTCLFHRRKEDQDTVTSAVLSQDMWVTDEQNKIQHFDTN